MANNPKAIIHETSWVQVGEPSALGYAPRVQTDVGFYKSMEKTMKDTNVDGGVPDRTKDGGAPDGVKEARAAVDHERQDKTETVAKVYGDVVEGGGTKK